MFEKSAATVNVFAEAYAEKIKPILEEVAERGHIEHYEPLSKEDLKLHHLFNHPNFTELVSSHLGGVFVTTSFTLLDHGVFFSWPNVVNDDSGSLTNRYEQALHKILEENLPNCEGYETDTVKIAREALGISEEELFGGINDE